MSDAARRDEIDLARACAAGDPGALARFESHYLVLIDLVAHRMGAPPAIAAEAKQTLRSRLLVGEGGAPRIADFRGTGPLAGWLAVAASRLLWKLLQRTRRGVDEAAGLAEIIVGEDPELNQWRARSTAQFRSAFAAALAVLTDEERALLRASALEGRSLDDLAAADDAPRASVSERLEGIRARLRDETGRALVAARGRVGSLKPCPPAGQ